VLLIGLHATGPVKAILGLAATALAILALAGCAAPATHDVIIRGGTVYDGTGTAPVVTDIAIDGDAIAAVGDLSGANGHLEVDAAGLAVAPGFINMLSWAPFSLMHDGRGQSDIRQGVTLEVFGEGWSMGPVNDEIKRTLERFQTDFRFDITWKTLGEYLDGVVERGVSPNVASYVGATTVRIHVLGFEDRPPTPDELETMRGLVREAMEEGAMGVGSSLIYAPAFFADTGELVELAKVAAEYGGGYISHLRSEGNRLLEAVDELITIASEAGARAEIYHLKAAGRSNWDKLDDVVARVEAARARGLEVTADIYTYTAGATGLDAAMPPWVQEGGFEAWARRLQDVEIRDRVKKEMLTPTDEWENLFLAAGPEGMLFSGFRNEALRPLIGRTLAEVAAERGTSPADTIMDLIVEDGSRVETLYFLMSEDNVRKKVALEWVSFGSDAAAMAPEGLFLNENPHPRTYGNFARLLGKYVRDEGIIPLEEAIRRLTSLPANNLALRNRGALRPGYFADVVVFDPASIADRATYEVAQQYSTGMVHVFINGARVLRDGEHTGALPGRVVRGPGWTGWTD
jgi:N-acyl-D-amino-acid deacylase